MQDLVPLLLEVAGQLVGLGVLVLVLVAAAIHRVQGVVVVRLLLALLLVPRVLLLRKGRWLIL
jgi:hypothetical protein